MLKHSYDPCETAILNPDMIVEALPDFPAVTISCFARRLFQSVCDAFHAKEIGRIHSAGVDTPIYELMYQGKRFAFYQSGVGEPKCVAEYEEILAMGSKCLILFGNCGVLDAEIKDCGIIIPTQAIRDEGCSYHYAPPSDTIEVNKKYRELFYDTCHKFAYPYVQGTTWTTDAIYRETQGKVSRHKGEGAICVEMECAGMQALCDFRKTDFFTFFYAGDHLQSNGWDPRSVSDETKLDEKSKIALLAFELGVRIMESQAL